MAALSADQLTSYLNRINFEIHRNQQGIFHPPKPSIQTLSHLHWSHLKSIPFENLSLRLEAAKAHPPSANPVAAFTKLVNAKRGGYCYEQNAVFTCALRALGFTVIDGSARVVIADPPPDQAPPPPGKLLLTPAGSHRIAFVHIDNSMYLVDVGFGGEVAPLPLLLPPDEFSYSGASSGTSIAQLLLGNLEARGDSKEDFYLNTLLPLDRIQQYRLFPGVQGEEPPQELPSGADNLPNVMSTTRGSAAGVGQSCESLLQRKQRQGYYLQRFNRRKGLWKSLYFFNLQEELPQDFDAQNYITATSPTSLFVNNTLVARNTDKGRLTIFNDTFRSFDNEGELLEERKLSGEVAELLDVLKEHFDILI